MPTAYSIPQPDAACTDPLARGVVGRHLAWRYGLRLLHDGRAIELSDAQRSVPLSPEDRDLTQLSTWLQRPLPRETDGGGVLGCPLDDLERRWLDRARLQGAVRALPATFRVWLSHDIDQLRMSYQLATWTFACLRRGRVGAAARLLRDWAGARLRNSDLFWNLERLVRVEDELGVRATYFFLHQRPFGSWRVPATLPFRLGLYSMRDSKVQALVRDVQAAGGEIGLHGSMGSARSAGLLREELEMIAASGVAPPVVGRQHWLDFDLWGSADLLSDAGISLDSSIGFNPPGWGFRTRTAWPHLLPSARADSLSSVLHVAPCIMDGALHSDWRAQIEALLATAVARHATLAVIWHNTAIARTPETLDAYRWLIVRARELGGEFVVGADLLRLHRHPS